MDLKIKIDPVEPTQPTVLGTELGFRAGYRSGNGAEGDQPEELAAKEEEEGGEEEGEEEEQGEEEEEEGPEDEGEADTKAGIKASRSGGCKSDEDNKPCQSDCGPGKGLTASGKAWCWTSGAKEWCFGGWNPAGYEHCSWGYCSC